MKSTYCCQAVLNKFPIIPTNFDNTRKFTLHHGATYLHFTFAHYQSVKYLYELPQKKNTTIPKISNLLHTNHTTYCVKTSRTVTIGTTYNHSADVSFCYYEFAKKNDKANENNTQLFFSFYNSGWRFISKGTGAWE